MAHIPFSELVGKTLVTAEVNGSNDEILFVTTEGEKYKLLHFQDCCEAVEIEDIDGELEDLIGSPILVAEEVSDKEIDVHRLLFPAQFQREECSESHTWTFYKIDTAKGGVFIRWFGASNGYYSESVDFVKADEDGEFGRW